MSFFCCAFSVVANIGILLYYSYLCVSNSVSQEDTHHEQPLDTMFAQLSAYGSIQHYLQFKGYLLLSCFLRRHALVVDNQGMDGQPVQGDASGATAKPAPVLPLHAGDLHFEYPPASGPDSPGGGGGGEGKGEDGGESNRAPSPGGYSGLRRIHVVSWGLCRKVPERHLVFFALFCFLTCVLLVLFTLLFFSLLSRRRVGVWCCCFLGFKHAGGLLFSLLILAASNCCSSSLLQTMLGQHQSPHPVCMPSHIVFYSCTLSTSLHVQPAVPASAAGTSSESGILGDSGAPRRESSAEMFERLVREHSVPRRRLFSLLARVRATVAWGGGLEARRAAVRRRIMALTALVYCHPSQGVDRGREAGRRRCGCTFFFFLALVLIRLWWW